MDAELVGLVRLVLSVVGLGLLIFTLGALAGWRWAVPQVRHEPTWMFLTGHVGWLAVMVSLVMAPSEDGWGWSRWLVLGGMVCWAIAMAIQIRARAAERSGNREAS